MLRIGVRPPHVPWFSSAVVSSHAHPIPGQVLIEDSHKSSCSSLVLFVECRLPITLTGKNMISLKLAQVQWKEGSCLFRPWKYIYTVVYMIDMPSTCLSLVCSEILEYAYKLMTRHLLLKMQEPHGIWGWYWFLLEIVHSLCLTLCNHEAIFSSHVNWLFVAEIAVAFAIEWCPLAPVFLENAIKHLLRNQASRLAQKAYARWAAIVIYPASCNKLTRIYKYPWWRAYCGRKPEQFNTGWKKRIAANPSRVSFPTVVHLKLWTHWDGGRNTNLRSHDPGTIREST